MKLRPEAIKAMTTCEIPSHMHGGLIRYFEDGIEPGGFLCALLDNDLMGAAGKADSMNLRSFHAYAMWLYNHAPHGSYGYTGAVRDWLKMCREGATPSESPV